MAVNTLANIAEVTIRGSLEAAGAEHPNIDFVEMEHISNNPDEFREARRVTRVGPHDRPVCSTRWPRK